LCDQQHAVKQIDMLEIQIDNALRCVASMRGPDGNGSN
jgi:hypothetical protein